MADIVTKQQLENASVDADSLEVFVSGSDMEDVLTRLGQQYPSLAKLVRILMETGGWKAYQTEAALLATTPTVDPSVGYAFDTKKMYLWNGTSWIDEGLSQLDQSIDYTNQKTEFWQAGSGGVTIQAFGAFSKYAVGFVGANGKMPFGIDKEGKAEADQLRANNVDSDQVETKEFKMPDFEMKALDSISGFVWGVVGGNKKMPLAIGLDGTVHAEKIKVGSIDIASEAATAFKDANQEWWIYPSHIYSEQPFPRVISGVYSELGEIIVGEYVIGQGITKRFKVGQTAIVDDHNAPSVWAKSGHRSIVMWQEHDQTNHLFARTSTKDGDISTLEYAATQQISAGQPISYTQLHHSESESTVTEDIFYVFSRFNQTSWGFTKISVNQETGVITTLDQHNILTASAQYYMTSTLADNKFRIASTFNPGIGTNTIHYWEIDIATGVMTDHLGNAVGNIITHTSLPVDIATVAPLLAQKANYRRRLFYVRPLPMSPAIAFAEWLTADAANTGIYKVIALENGSWVERNYANVGKAFNTTYFSGMSFPDPCVKDEVIVCRYDNATNQGVLERVLNVNEMMITIETERVDTDFLIRPIAPKNGGSLCAVSQLYSYGATGTFSFESDVKFKFLK